MGERKLGAKSKKKKKESRTKEKKNEEKIEKIFHMAEHAPLQPLSISLSSLKKLGVVSDVVNFTFYLN